MNRSLVILAILGVLSSLVSGAQKVRGVAPESIKKLVVYSRNII